MPKAGGALTWDSGQTRQQPGTALGKAEAAAIDLSLSLGKQGGGAGRANVSSRHRTNPLVA